MELKGINLSGGRGPLAGLWSHHWCIEFAEQYYANFLRVHTAGTIGLLYSCIYVIVYWRTMIYSTHRDNYVVVFYVCSVIRQQRRRLFSIHEAGCKMLSRSLMILSKPVYCVDSGQQDGKTLQNYLT